MLRLGLEYCKDIDLRKIMLACYKDNSASRRTIEKCGGILEREFVYFNGKMVQVYWINI
jgi:predicted acetyltransferase